MAVVEPNEPPNCGSWKAELANQISSKKITEEFDSFKGIYDVSADFPAPKAVEYALRHNIATQAALETQRKSITKLAEGSKVCIIGAGMSGLYIAMILDALKIENLSYDILEGSDRVGGRVFTHRFSDARHDYYDVGAMRFPDVPIMKKTFDLFQELKVDQIPYYMSSPMQPSRYNDVTVIGESEDRDPDRDPDPFRVSETYQGKIDAELVMNHKKYVTQAFEPFKERMVENWQKGLKALLKYDNFSVRGYMMSHGITPLEEYHSIQWLETLTDGSGLYDQAFAEGVIDSLDFDYYTEYLHKEKTVSWGCIDGGTSRVPEAMHRRLETSVSMNQRVKKIKLIRRDNEKSSIEVTHTNTKVEDAKDEHDEYITVFATPTLACLQRMDLTDLELIYEQKDALRSLHYDTASKVGMKFKSPWWIGYGIRGGLGKTDMPLRTCVYPSYNIEDSGPSVLLCSYSWSQDAARLGSLMKGDWKKEHELRDLMFNNLTWLHLEHAQKKDPETTFNDLYTEISNSYIEHHAYDWHNDSFTSGKATPSNLIQKK